MKITRFVNFFRVTPIAAAIAFAGCISPESPLLQAGGLCEGTDRNEVDAKVKVFVDAAENFDHLAGEVKGDIKTACANVATDLGATDTWGNIEKPDEAIWNDDGTGACNAAAKRIQEIMDANPNANFALLVTRGQCHQDLDMFEECSNGCDTNHSCEPGDVTTRCEPGDMSMICSAECTATSFCEGTPEHSCNCVGRCEANCVGQCDGQCIHADGSMTENDPNCNGKCSSSCHGACEGACQEEQNVTCGAEVRCRGECTTEFSDPVCESFVGPPDCSDNKECHEACACNSAAHPICEPPHVKLLCNSRENEDLAKLVDTIDENFGKLWELAETKGPLIADAVERLSVTGEAVVNAAGDLDGKSLACAKDGVKAAHDASITIRVVQKAGVEVTKTASSRAK